MTQTKQLFTLFLTLGFVALITGCATILHGTDQEVYVDSSPKSAKVEIKTSGGVSVFNGLTPARVELDRDRSYDVFVNLEGYQQSVVHISREFDALYLGNIICGGIIGLIIDAANGAMYKLEPESINVTLVTASLDGYSKKTYAVLRTLDAEGQLRTMVVPLIPSM
jgi:hypothetical protein